MLKHRSDKVFDVSSFYVIHSDHKDVYYYMQTFISGFITNWQVIFYTNIKLENSLVFVWKSMRDG